MNTVVKPNPYSATLTVLEPDENSSVRSQSALYAIPMLHFICLAVAFALEWHSQQLDDKYYSSSGTGSVVAVIASILLWFAGAALCLIRARAIRIPSLIWLWLGVSTLFNGLLIVAYLRFTSMSS